MKYNLKNETMTRLGWELPSGPHLRLLEPHTGGVGGFSLPPIPHLIPILLCLQVLNVAKNYRMIKDKTVLIKKQWQIMTNKHNPSCL